MSGSQVPLVSVDEQVLAPGDVWRPCAACADGWARAGWPCGQCGYTATTDAHLPAVALLVLAVLALAVLGPLLLLLLVNLS